jgi:signal transduction histidine kinase
MGESSRSRPPPPAADYNLRILWPLARYVEDHFGAQGLRAIADAAHVDPALLDGANRWVDAAAFEALIARVRTLVADDAEFKRACIHRIKEAYGPLRYLLWAMTPGGVFAQGAKQFRVVSTCGELEIKEHGRTWVQSSFRSRVPFSRLNCLIRQAQGAAMPTMWGLPPAHVRETACIARGDETCEIRFHWYEARRWLPSFVGAVIFAAVGLLLARLGPATISTPLGMAALGAGLGYLFEVRRTERLNEHTREEVLGALREMAHGETDARRELLEMHGRQKDWTRLVEEEMTSRAAAIQKVVADVQEVQSARASTLLGFSHDLRNPLQIIQMSTEYLKGVPALKADKDAAESLADIHQSIDRMRRMLGDLVHLTKAQREFVTMEPQDVPTTGLTDGLRRRLRALVQGRDVRSTVFATRETPESIAIDPLALDRILDNLLTNAAKYTERGSIIVELDGTPGYLVIKVSDTGCGIAAEDLERIFDPGGSNPKSRRGDSFGVGLSVVVQLLDQIGGRLEVMSRPAAGTTFWVNLPIVAERRSTVPSSADLSLVTGAAPAYDISRVAALSRVVRIRRLPA